MNSNVQSPAARPQSVSQEPITVRAIDHVNISVKDLERAADFYSRVFGFHEVENGRGRKDARFVIMSAQGRAFLALHENPDTSVPDVPFVNHWGFAVADFDAVVERIRSLGVHAAWDHGDNGIAHWARSRSIYVYDPDGHEIELAERFGGGLRED